jgi:hypothetical protein
VRSTLRRPVTLADNRAYKFWSDWKATRDLRNDVAHEDKVPKESSCSRAGGRYSWRRRYPWEALPCPDSAVA